MPGRNTTEKKKKVNELIKKIEGIVEKDRYFAKRSPSFNSSINRFRPTFFKHFQILTSFSSSRRSTSERDPEDDLVEEGGETAFERMVREDNENDLQDCEF